jgi:hypothetical protein
VNIRRGRSGREKAYVEKVKKTVKEAKRQQAVKTMRDEKRKQNKKPCLINSKHII